MKKVLFVCLGNICRSPLAEGVFKHLIKQKSLENDFFADSCGTAGYHVGEKPDYRMTQTANDHGVILDHIGRQIKKEDLDEFDLILVMDRENYQDVMNLSNSKNKTKIHLLREFDPEAASGAEVPDPYYGDQSGFEDVYQMAVRSCENIITFLEAEDD